MSSLSSPHSSHSPNPSLGRQLQRVWWGVKTLVRHGRPSLLVHFDGGLGDDLMLTAVFRELHRRGGRRLWIMSRTPELFGGNSDVHHVLPPSNESLIVLRRLGVPILPCHYHSYDAANDRDLAPPLHYIAMMCRGAGIEGVVRLRPYLHLTSAELETGRFGSRQLAIQTSAQGARFPMPNKDWPPGHFAQLVPALIRRGFTVVQLGLPTDPTFPGVIDKRGTTTLRETAAILTQSEVFIGLAGFLMHVARAVDTRAVILFGGREDPSISGYSGFDNLTTKMACAPCWQRHTCAYGRECQSRITPEMVMEALDRQLQQRGLLVPTEEVTLRT